VAMLGRSANFLKGSASSPAGGAHIHQGGSASGQRLCHGVCKFRCHTCPPTSQQCTAMTASQLQRGTHPRLSPRCRQRPGEPISNKLQMQTREGTTAVSAMPAAWRHILPTCWHLADPSIQHTTCVWAASDTCAGRRASGQAGIPIACS
jgi:hypothetical protein